MCRFDKILNYSFFWKDISEIYEDSLAELRDEFSHSLEILNEAYEKRLEKLEESSKG